MKIYAEKGHSLNEVERLELGRLLLKLGLTVRLGRERQGSLSRIKRSGLSDLMERYTLGAYSTSEMVNDLIQLMPDPIRTVLEQRLFCEYSFKEMGKSLGCREDAAQRRYSRALEALRERTQAEGYEC